MLEDKVSLASLIHTLYGPTLKEIVCMYPLTIECCMPNTISDVVIDNNYAK